MVLHAMGLFRWVLPPGVVDRVDLDRLESVPCTFVSDELTERLADLVFCTPLRSDPDRYLYLLLEHQSVPDPLIVDRVDEYVHRITSWVRQNQPERVSDRPLVVPVVVHQGVNGWKGPRRLHHETHELFPS